jgi:hypothetical protein
MSEDRGLVRSSHESFRRERLLFPCDAPSESISADDWVLMDAAGDRFDAVVSLSLEADDGSVHVNDTRAADDLVSFGDRRQALDLDEGAGASFVLIKTLVDGSTRSGLPMRDQPGIRQDRAHALVGKTDAVAGTDNESLVSNRPDPWCPLHDILSVLSKCLLLLANHPA